MRKILIILIVLISIFLYLKNFHPLAIAYAENKVSDITGINELFESKSQLKIKKLVIKKDKDKDGIYDLEDILQGARKDAKNKPKYISKYYKGGYPPKNEGVCTDVIWRAYLNAGYNIKKMLDRDIRKNRKDYPHIKKPDGNIDFRRVKNQFVFFKKYGKNLTTKLTAYDKKNLKEWQGGDIVTFDEPSHIAIVSDNRNEKGIPYLIHNWFDHTREINDFEYWHPYITGHFRYPKG